MEPFRKRAQSRCGGWRRQERLLLRHKLIAPQPRFWSCKLNSVSCTSRQLVLNQRRANGDRTTHVIDAPWKSEVGMDQEKNVGECDYARR